MPVPPDVHALLDIGLARGLHSIGIAPAAPFTRARTILEERKARGLHADMAFTYKNPTRSTDPGAAVRGARSVVVGAWRYQEAAQARPTGALGAVARYAWRDHYVPLRAALWAMAHHLRALGWRAVAFADDNSLVDREAAYLAGLGWYGKNANILLPGAGSWFVLGAVVTDAPLPAAAEPLADGCGSCRRCLDGCPTGAIIAPGVVDANRCLAWLVQRPGPFPVEYRVALGDRIYGCDDCQEVCPPNVRSAQPGPSAAWPDSSDDSRAPARPWVGLVELLEASDDEVLATCGSWYLADRDPRWLRRNALVALANVAARAPAGGTADGTVDSAVVAVLHRYLTGIDPMLRGHAVWAARRLGRDDLLVLLGPDQPAEVLAELALTSAS